jgi:NADH-quinone oxidoreductase subunit A
MVKFAGLNWSEILAVLQCLKGDYMMSYWVYIGIFLVVALALPVVAVTLPAIIGPRKPSVRKEEVYECGIATKGDVRVQFKSQYYIYTLIFLIFDVETVFLFPWAVSLGKLPLFAVIEGVIFIVILFAGLVYAIRKGVLTWA